jgi:spermidine/putrescine transport system ATP-binding protein
MQAGRLEQVGTGRELYDTPQTAFVAAFVGEANALPGTVGDTADGIARIGTGCGPLLARNPHGLRPGAAAVLFVRPEYLLPGDAGEPAANCIAACVTDVAYEGNQTHLGCAAAAGGRLLSLLGPRDPPAPGPGQKVLLRFAPEDAVLLPPSGTA